MSASLATRIAQEFAQGVQPQSGQAAVRRQAIQALAEQGLPTSRDENWKYVNLRPLDKVRFTPVPAELERRVTAQELPPVIPGHARYTFVDGIFAPSLSAPVSRVGVEVTFGTAPASDAGQPSADGRFALLNQAFALDGALIKVAPNADCPGCIEVVFVASTEAKAGASYPRVLLEVGAGARVGLIERHVSIGSDANFINGAIDVSVGASASVQHYRVQQTGARAIWFDTLTARLQQHASYRLYSISLGALSARSTIRVQLLGQHAEVALLAASVGGKNQVHDTYALMEHVAPNARTEQSFRGIAAGRSRVACNATVVVRKGAHGTDSSQSLRGLLAGSDAEIDVRPQLEIYTDDVRCNHGATAGKLDDNMLFYLLSRGLDRDTAQRLLKWAFLEDVVARIEIPELRRQIEASLAGQLTDAVVMPDALPAPEKQEKL